MKDPFVSITKSCMVIVENGIFKVKCNPENWEEGLIVDITELKKWGRLSYFSLNCKIC